MLTLQEFKSLIERPEISDYNIINMYSRIQINSESALKDVKKACNQALLPLHSDKTADYDKDEYLKVSAVKDSLRLYHEKIENAEVEYRQYVEEVIKKEKERIERLRQEEEEEKWILVRKKKKDERKAKRSPGGNNKKKNTRDVETKKAAEDKAKKEEEAARRASIAKEVAKERTKMAAEESAAADGIQAMDIDGVSNLEQTPQ